MLLKDLCSSWSPIVQLSFWACYFQEARFVARMVGAHEAIPEIEVNAVVAAHFFMVHRVVGGGIKEKLQGSLHEPTGVKLVAGVSKDVVGKLPHHEDSECEWMDRDQERGEWKDAGLDQGFGGVEGIGGPRRGIVG